MVAFDGDERITLKDIKAHKWVINPDKPEVRDIQADLS